MEKENYSQLELFSQAEGSRVEKARHNGFFLAQIWKYEKVILLVISFIITAAIFFSLGIEKGKRLALSKLNSRLDLAAKENKNSIVAKRVNISPAKQEDVLGEKIISRNQRAISAQDEPARVILGSPANLNSYTIQVASFTTRSNAQKEVERLKAKGFSALVITKGKYSIVCVGNFSEKENAFSLLSKLKAKYRDCLIRRL